MNDDGYTLAEMLAALAILGMAIGGLGLVVSLIARQQLTALHLHNRLTEARAADSALETLMTREQSAGADLRDLRGDADSLSFTCGAATCAARLVPDGRRTVLLLRDRSGAARRLRLRARNLRFSYVGASGSVEGWPAARPSGGVSLENIVQGQAPQAIILRSAAGAPLAVIRTAPREPRDCQYDAIAGACRATTR
jgi:prepilin-type N-terminal cleavage/methylation domain-containing protein